MAARAEQAKAAIAHRLRVAPENPSARAVQIGGQADNVAVRQHSALQAADKTVAQRQALAGDDLDRLSR
jgi:hypothetical protein